jgi:hypothetical protein
VTDLEKFKQLFDTCSIWRGGGNIMQSQDGQTVYTFNIAVDDAKRQYHKKYVELVAYFDADGNWVRTVEAGPAKRRR